MFMILLVITGLAATSCIFDCTNVHIQQLKHNCTCVFKFDSLEKIIQLLQLTLETNHGIRCQPVLFLDHVRLPLLSHPLQSSNIIKLVHKPVILLQVKNAYTFFFFLKYLYMYIQDTCL